MKQDRRGFLKLFGLSSAAVASATAKEPSIETFESEAPLAPPQRDYGDYLNVVSEPLWSQLRIEPNTMKSVYSLFQDPRVDGSLAETNMLMHGQLPMPEAYSIDKIGFVFSPTTIPALRSAFIDRYALGLFLGNKRYWQAPLSTIFSVADPSRDEKGFATLPDEGFAKLDIPLVIEAGVYFNLTVIGKPIYPCGKIIGWGVFKGLHAYGIQ
jgi:hypothetical protein